MRKSHIAIIALSLAVACLSACMGSEKNNTNSDSAAIVPQANVNSGNEENTTSVTNPAESESDSESSQNSVENDNTSASFETTEIDEAGEPPFPDYDSGYEDFLSGRFSEEQINYINSLAFMGDSTCLSFTNYGLLSKTRCFADVGLGARNIRLNNFVVEGELYTLEQVLKKTSCTEFFFMLGLNDINLIDSGEYIEKYSAFLNFVEEIRPDVTINVVSITPVVYGSKFCSSGRIADFNESLKQMTSQNSWKYVDLYSLVSDGYGNLSANYAMSDGIHLRCAAYYNFLEYLVNNQQTPVSENSPESNSAASVNSADIID